MKIIAIRGANLASIKDEFCIDFESAPLKDTGLFAITGATGSGKSTILDTMCLALYDKIPRIKKTNTTPIGYPEESKNLRVKTNDVRSILRRGAISGFAEVTFKGIDGLNYQARWAVRRARNSPQGRLQAQTLSLICLSTDKNLSGKKVETLLLIQQKVGLNFEQFCRSILLAQGDFANFLKANVTEKATLLEKMTGTEIYSYLSTTTHEKANKAGQLLKQHQMDADYIKILSSEDKANYIKNKTSALKILSEIKPKINFFKNAITWWNNLESYQNHIEQAEIVLKQTESQLNELSEIKSKIQSFHSIDEIRHVVFQNKIDNNKNQELETRLMDLDKEITATKEQIAYRKNTKVDLEQRLSSYHKALKDLQPKIQKVKEIDLKLGYKNEAIENYNSQLNKLTQQLHDKKQSIFNSKNKLKTLENTISETQKWLNDNHNIRLLIDKFSLVESHLNRRSQIHKIFLYLERKNKSLHQEQQSINQSINAITDQWNIKLEQQKLLEKKINDISGYIESTDGNALQKNYNQLKEKLTLVEQLKMKAEMLQNNQNDLENKKRIHQTYCHQKKEFSDCLETIDNKFDGISIEINKTKLAYTTVPDKVIAQLRADLIESVPCLVCGSLEHPWRQNDNVNKYMQLKLQIQSLEKEQSTLQIQRTVKHAQLEQANEHIIFYENQILDIEKQFKARLHYWQQQMQTLKLNTDLNNTTLEQLKLLQHKLNNETKMLANNLDKLHSHHELQQNYYRQLSQTKKELEKINHENSMLLIKKNNNLQEITIISSRENQLSVEETYIRSELERYLYFIPEWKTYSVEEYNLIVNQYKNTINRYEKQQHNIELHTVDHGKINEHLKSFIANADLLENEINSSKIAIKNLKNDYNALHNQRKMLFNDQDINQILDDFNNQIETATNKLHLHQEKIETNKQKYAGLLSEQKIVNEQICHNRTVVDQQVKTINYFLAKKDWTQEQLENALKINSDWVTTQSKEIHLLEKQKIKQQSVCEQWHFQLEEHKKQSVDHSLESCIKQLVELEKEHENATKQHTEIILLLEQDEQRQQELLQHSKELNELKSNFNNWNALKTVIGSHDGSRFRKFVQNLTLDNLLLYANLHLKELARRYYLQRVPNTDLELQVIDRYMGDEVRSVYSLSGGESFLVSLALALGLSSLSVNQTAIESLFIDEGFGSLDSQTLDIALDALDTLQAQGRKIGIVSHVESLIDRVSTQITLQNTNNGHSTVVIN